MTSLRRQRGATLVVALIMLVLTTLFALSSMKTATTSLIVTGNMQAKTEALNAAQETIEAVISTPQFIANPANAVINPCTGPNTRCTDVTGDGAPEYVTRLVPQPEWEISAHAQGVNSGANVTVRQGIGIRISADEAEGAC